jgi:hypothetical protein
MNIATVDRMLATPVAHGIDEEARKDALAVRYPQKGEIIRV